MRRSHLAAVLGVVLAIVALIVSLGYNAGAEKRLDASRAAHEDLLQFRDEYLELSRRVSFLEKKRGLTSVQGIVEAVERTITPLGLRDSVKSIKPVRADGPHEERAEVLIQGVGMNEMVNLLYAVERAPMLLIIRKAEMRTSFENPEQFTVTLMVSLMKPEQ
jgi:hypothetical protein